MYSAGYLSTIAIEPLIDWTKEHFPNVSLEKWFRIDDISA